MRAVGSQAAEEMGLAAGVSEFKLSVLGWQVARKSVMMVSGKLYALNEVKSSSTGL